MRDEILCQEAKQNSRDLSKTNVCARRLHKILKICLRLPEESVAQKCLTMIRPGIKPGITTVLEVSENELNRT